jgi:hypothetical protein
MSRELIPPVGVNHALIEAITAFPLVRKVAHCGTTLRVSSFDFFATCPVCETRMKLRALSAAPDLEDVFDAVFAWMAQPGATELVRRRQQQIAAAAD